MAGRRFYHRAPDFTAKSAKAAIGVAFAAVVALALPASAKRLQAQNGDVLVAGGIGANQASISSAEFYSVSDGTFHPAPPMHGPRAAHQAQTVPPGSEADSPGNVTIAGGFKGSVKLNGSAATLRMDPLSTVERFYPAKDRFLKATNKNNMDVGRALAASAVFPNPFAYAPFVSGHVLIAGGICDSSDLSKCKTGDILHPDGGLTSSGPLNTERIAHTLTVLQNGTVLAAGGFSDLAGDTLSSAEIFDPQNHEQFTSVASPMNAARAGHTATLLNDGTVLIVGGLTNSGGSLSATNTVEVYNPGTGAFTAVGPLNQARAGHTATLLADGTVLIAGGFDGSVSFSISRKGNAMTATLSGGSGSILDSAEIYNPTAQTFSCVGGGAPGKCASSMSSPRVAHTATMLGSGAVLIAGGIGGATPKPLSSAELYNGSFTATASMKSARALHTASVISE